MTYKDRWALVTGASAGIGAAFARALAAKGANVALAARRESRLMEIAASIERDCGTKTRIVAADLADPKAPDAIERALDGLPIDILVNNAGYGLPGRFNESPWSAHRDFIELMMTSCARLAYGVLPGMQQRRWGRIVNVASLAGLVPGSAGHTLYGAVKAFLVSFSQSLAAENEAAGIKVSALCPGFTWSEFHDVNGTRPLVAKLPEFMFMRAEPVALGALAAVERGHVVYVPGGWNKFVAGLAKALPRPWAAEMVKSQTKNFRRGAGP
jgi:hypothetical protein